jgi:hypothetical protein
MSDEEAEIGLFKIGLSKEQVLWLTRVCVQYRQKITLLPSTEANRLYYTIFRYLLFLTSGCECRYEGSSPEMRHALRGLAMVMRKKMLSALDGHLGHNMSAAEMVQRISMFVAVPDFLVAAISRDIERLRLP